MREELRVSTVRLQQLRDLLYFEKEMVNMLSEELSDAGRFAGPAVRWQYEKLALAVTQLADFYHIMAHASDLISGEVDQISRKARAEFEDNILAMKKKSLF